MNGDSQLTGGGASAAVDEEAAAAELLDDAEMRKRVSEAMQVRAGLLTFAQEIQSVGIQPGAVLSGFAMATASIIHAMTRPPLQGDAEALLAEVTAAMSRSIAQLQELESEQQAWQREPRMILTPEEAGCGA